MLSPVLSEPADMIVADAGGPAEIVPVTALLLDAMPRIL